MALTRKQIGARLREIREEIGFTQAEIATRLGVHRPTISEIEAGRRAVTSEELFRFSEFYARPLSDLLSEPQPNSDSVLQAMFRARGDKQGPEARLAVERFMERCRAERELETLLGLPRPAEARPAYRVAEPQSRGDAIRQGESIATQERRRLDLGAQPVRGILDLLERQGVSIGPLLADPNAKSDLGIDGVYFETGSLGACIAVNLNDGESASFRDVFTAAHEYAHWLLRDRQIELFSFEAGTTDLLEVRANAFAASFLLPRDGLRDYFQRTGVLRGEMLSHVSPGDIVRAMDHFGVSRQALLYRLKNTGLITEPTRLSLWSFSVGDTAARMGIVFGSREYAGTRLPMLAIHAWRQGLITTARAAELCAMDIEAYRDLVQAIGETPQEIQDLPLLGAAAE